MIKKKILSSWGKFSDFFNIVFILTHISTITLINNDLTSGPIETTSRILKNFTLAQSDPQQSQIPSLLGPPSSLSSSTKVYFCWKTQNFNSKYKLKDSLHSWNWRSRAENLVNFDTIIGMALGFGLEVMRWGTHAGKKILLWLLDLAQRKTTNLLHSLSKKYNTTIS